MDERIALQMLDAEEKAWDSLVRYKFWMFGYYASQWVLLNHLRDRPLPNPFASLTKVAREHNIKVRKPP